MTIDGVSCYDARMKVAALFVDRRGPYWNRDDVDAWDVERDARKYAGPWPVVAHPPCERFGRWAGVLAGQDDGCFLAAISSVRSFGGVIEHPADSKAWRIYGLNAPPRAGGWVPSGDGGWTCCVEQGHYGHRARKATWLYVMHSDPTELMWGASVAAIVPRPGRDPIRERRIGAVQRMGRAERRRTPPAFAELLISLARHSRSCVRTTLGGVLP